MITHMVLLKLKKSTPRPRLDRVFTEIGDLRKRIPGIASYSYGPYSSPEGLHQGYTHGFCMTFEDAASRDAYLIHPAHEKVKKNVLEVLDGGLAGVVAFDYQS